MTARLSVICGLLSSAEVFADVGCDHGNCTKYMFSNGLCMRAYITDVSAKSLKKAQTLLKQEIAKGVCIPVVCDGMDGVEEPCDLVLIAGMGGEEIVSILERKPLPARFVLQPMKNAEKVRRFLTARGARLDRDFMFAERGKYYEILRGTASGGSDYTERELRYGRENLRGNAVFLQMMAGEREKLFCRLSGDMQEESRAQLEKRLAEIEEVIHDAQGNL